MNIYLIRSRHHNIWEPIGLMYISSFVKKFSSTKINVKILDGFFLDEKKIIDEVNEGDIVGISGTTPQIPYMLRLSRKIKDEYPDKKIVVGGVGPSLQPEKFLKKKYIDHIVIGEGEMALLKIIEGKGGKIVNYPPINNLDLIPYPDRYLPTIDLEKYIRIAKSEEGRRVTSVLSSRGCPYRCTFCVDGYFGGIWRSIENVSGRIVYQPPVKLRLRNPQDVAKEIKKIEKEFNLDFIKFSDTEVNPTKKRFIQLAKSISQEKISASLGGNMRIDNIDDEVCKWAKKAGFEEFWVGVESGDDEVLKRYRKGITTSMIKKAFDSMKKYDIKTKVYILLGEPNEDWESIRKTVELLEEIDPDIVNVSILFPYPGTMYWNEKYDKMIDWENADEYSNNFWKTKYLTNKELKQAQALILRKFKDRLSVTFSKKVKSGIIKL